MPPATLAANLLLAALLLLPVLPATAPPAAPAATFTVNSVDDTDDGTCNAAHCSLREAIKAANAAGGADTIAFNIPGSGVRTILPDSPLPAVTGPVLLDGLTQPGASCASWPPALRIELQGINAGGVFDIGLNVLAADSTVRGLVINGWTGAASACWAAATRSSAPLSEPTAAGRSTCPISSVFLSFTRPAMSSAAQRARAT